MLPIAPNSVSLLSTPLWPLPSPPLRLMTTPTSLLLATSIEGDTTAWTRLKESMSLLTTPPSMPAHLLHVLRLANMLDWAYLPVVSLNTLFRTESIRNITPEPPTILPIRWHRLRSPASTLSDLFSIRNRLHVRPSLPV